jgi:2-hydroxymuconate-semialdehyde hydrolase
MLRDIADVYRPVDFTFEGIPVRYLEGGAGFPILLLHGSGPGASTLGNWRSVLIPLAERFKVYAMDLVGFGDSGRKPAPPYFDMDLWLRQAHAMARRIDAPRFGVVGHSVSGALALKLAAFEPRVAAVLTSATMGRSFPINAVTARAWTFPEDRTALRRTAEGLVFNPALIDETYLSNRERTLFAGDYAAYFSAMFSGDKQRYIDAAEVPNDVLASITCGVTMLHGRNDAGFPCEATTLPMSRHLPAADVVLIGRCSHSIALEHPRKLIAAAAHTFLADA